ncbi:EAL domain-containing protein [Sphingomonas sp. BT-65]|uniref:putative bifunctional diguanylate cyclase/phosphodiesterase n=1 Tax=Sphingomonas sp. BT-65 TaxID=2989821 RepID=UPI0022357E86|nr:EAL domain-containing protein [Sphingomonas sp. BT-65]MCW4462346.1 EAL domain-containing protein [Sphingomonas sp. BT-65]
MIDVALCIAIDHNPWLVLVAVAICCAGAFAIAQTFERANQAGGWQRFGWVVLAAMAAGATIWCTHFVAMLAYRAKVPVTLDPVLTIVSLLVAIAGTGIGIAIATRPGRIWPVLGGAVFGGAITSMHYVGMAAYRIDGITQWRWGYVSVSVLCAIGFAAAAFAVLRSTKPGHYRAATGSVLLVTAIATLHFIAMTALRVTPLRLDDSALSPDAMVALALATGLVGLVVIAAGVLAAFMDRQTRNDALHSLRRMAMSDPLTGLPNRTHFQQALDTRLARARHAGTSFAAIAIDLERFKEVNDLHGHKAGDQVLVAIAGRIERAMGTADTVARLGGDEFVVLRDIEDRVELVAFVEQLDAILRAPLKIGGYETRVGASIGVAVYPDDAREADVLANNADLAMYRAKSMRHLGPCYYDAELDEAIRERRELANDLRLAIEGNQLDVHYQLQASVSTGDITGYEALVRWNHPQRGTIGPSVFVPIAEENGLILQLGEWVLRRACTDAMQWPHKSRVAVNVSPVQLAHADLPQLFHRVMLETGLPPRRLEIELTESAIMADRARALHVLRQIKALGVGVALDDFGTGYSSLETLRAFPFDKIKLDQFFVAEIESSPQAIAIIRAVLALGKSLSIPILAEGIETDDQLDALRREGCDEVQGFLLGRPVPSPVGTPAEPPRQAGFRAA